jgi:hypothetical protein
MTIEGDRFSLTFMTIAGVVFFRIQKGNPGPVLIQVEPIAASKLTKLRF